MENRKMKAQEKAQEEVQQEIYVVLTSVAEKAQAQAMSAKLIAEKLAACVTVLPGAQSHYVWQEQLCHETEYILLIKSFTSKWESLQKRILEIHPYQCPELIALPAQAVGQAYLQWMSQQLS